MEQFRNSEYSATRLACPPPGDANHPPQGHGYPLHGYPPAAGSTEYPPSVHNSSPYQGPALSNNPPPFHPPYGDSYLPNGYPLHGYPPAAGSNFYPSCVPTSPPVHPPVGNSPAGGSNYYPSSVPTSLPVHPPVGNSPYPPPGYPPTASIPASYNIPTSAPNPAANGSPYPATAGVSSHTPGPVTAYGRVCILGEQYITPINVDLVVNEKSLSLSGGDYTIKDVDGNPIFAVKGRVMSLHKHRTVYNMQGIPIVTMRASMLTAHHRWSVYRGRSEYEEDLVFTVRQSHMIQLKTELQVFLKGNDLEEACDFRVEGSFFKKSCTIYVGHTNNIIAQMHSKGKITNLLGSDQFAVTVYPNVDQAFIAALIVLLDEINDAR